MAISGILLVMGVFTFELSYLLREGSWEAFILSAVFELAWKFIFIKFVCFALDSMSMDLFTDW